MDDTAMSHTGAGLSFGFNGYYHESRQPAISMVTRTPRECVLLQQNGRCRALQRTLSARLLLMD